MPKKIYGLMAVALFAVTFYFSFPYVKDTLIDQSVSTTEVAELDSVVVEPVLPKMLYGMVVDSMLIIEDKVKRNQNISEILSAHNISHQKIFQLANLSKPIFDVRKIAANKKYTLICAQDSLKTAKALVYEHNPIEYVVFNLSDSMLIEKKEREVVIKERSVAGTIEANLAMTMAELGLPASLTNDFVDVFGWQVDFFRLQRGDRFKLIYEEKLVDDQVIGSGNIKAIYFEHFGNENYAFNYDQGNGIDYFDEKGNSLRKALLKYPLKFTRISSRYSGNRYHPVQKRWKAHRGTDFAAPRGTPIRSVGDGIVLEARYKGGNGNYVKVKHNSTYTTQYLHMSKIASGIKPGTRVRQGETIGYVGSTGLATGNHLCYRFWRNGVQIDALNVDLPPSEPIAEAHTAPYTKQKQMLLNKLNKIKFKTKDQVFASVK